MTDTKQSSEEVAVSEEGAKGLYASVLSQLFQFDRFKAFIHANYEFTPKIDHENRTIEYEVKELDRVEVIKRLQSVMASVGQPGSQIEVVPESALQQLKAKP